MRGQLFGGQTMSKIAGKLKTTKEKTYHALALFFGSALWIVIILGVLAALTGSNAEVAAVVGVYVFYGLLFALFYLISNAVYRATAFGNMLLLGPQQFPHLYEMVVEGSTELGMREPPKTFLYNSNGLLNAFARRLMGGRYVFLTSALVEVSSDDQVRFVVGHELGHHAAGHLNPWLNFLKLPAHFVPFLMPAYSRAREYSCDRIGAHLAKDATASRSALQMLGCGCRRLNATMNCEAFMAQEAKVPSVFGFLSEIFRSHPRLTRRVAAIRGSGMFADS
jgi:Zn-dependent protease with chaperone function